jgi:elongation factor Ts
VAKSEEFGKLAHEICLQIAALNPKFIKKEDIPEDIIESEKKAYNDQFSDAKKPEKVIEEIIKGKILKFKKENSLLEQLWVKDPEKTIKGLIEEKVAKFGENIAIKSFVRYEI